LQTLIIRPGAIGDSLLTLAVIQQLREQDTQAHVTLVGNAAVLPLARAFGLAEEVDNYDSSRWSELFSSAGIKSRELRSLLGQMERAIGWLPDPDGVVKQNLLAAGIKTVMVSSSRRPEGKWHLHRAVYMAETIGLPPIDITAPFVPPQRIVPLNAGTRPEYDRAPIAVHPGSAGANKCWPASHFLSLIDRLCSRGQPVLLLAGPADHERLATLLDALAPRYGKKLLRTLVNASLMEVAKQLLQCQCYIGNDSGITHLAAMLGIPTIAIFGPSDPANWRPLGPTVKVLRPLSPRCMEQLAVDTVMEALETFSLERSMPI
jgi:heptosyltransferase III